MGVYLSQPITEKESNDCESGWLKCGVSSMQGWRVTQEDAHNCVLDFDKGASFFAVYDGHGGHEVAEYTAKNLPDFIKKLESYKSGNFEQALIDAFIEFDSTLTQESVIAELKAIAMSRNESSDQAKEDEEGENVQELCEEARMPLTELIARYTTGGKTPALRRIAGETGSSTSSPASPYLKAKPSSSGEPGSSKDGGESSTSVNGLPEVNGEEVKESSDDAVAPATGKKDEGESSSGIVNGEHSKEESEATKNVKPNCSLDEEAKNESEEGKASPISIAKKTKEETSPDDDERQMKSAIRYAKKKATVTMLAQLFEDASDSDSDNDENFQANSSNVENEDDDEEAEAEDDDEEAEEEEDEDDDDSEEEDCTTEMRDDEETVGNDSGCTAVAALLVEQHLYVANAGDSRAVLCTYDGTAVDLSVDHKPDDSSELARITAAGGRVTPDGRVNGGLNLSRAIGDHFYKKCEGKDAREQMITALPDIKTWTVKPGEDEFLVLACDGIWNSLSSQEVVNFVRPLLQAGEKISSICEKLFDQCLASDTLGDGTGCDNMTCIIVQFDKDLGMSVPGEPAKRSASPLPESEEPNKRTKVDPTVTA